MPELVTSDRSPESAPCEVLVCGAFAGDAGPEFGATAKEIDRALDGYLSEFAADAGFRAKRSELLLLPTYRRLPAKAVALVGLGSKGTAGSDQVRRAAASAARKLSERSVVASALHSDVEASTAATAEGFLLGSHQGPTYKKDPRRSKLQRVELLSADPHEVERGVARARATLIARDLANEPASVLTPDVFAQRARDLADAAGLTTEILEEKELADRGFGGILAVSAGSVVPPRLIHLSYRPPDPSGRIALVGKGVTFDSGGLSLKDARGMETMKTDMGGGAAVIGAMTALSALGIRHQVDAYIPTTENMPSGSALKPGDVIHHYGGRTTEVLNTDAEGRLILGDALALASESGPDAIVDVATLTGAMSVALGKQVSGGFATDDDMWQDIAQAAADAGEPLWRMPLHEGYRKSLDSDVADSRNIGARFGGAIVAALYLQAFVADGIPWAHLDIAGTGRAESADDIVPKGATGVAARTLLAWLERKSA